MENSVTMQLDLDELKLAAKSVKQKEAWRAKYGVLLAWSNLEASDQILIRKALIDPHLCILLDALGAFGLDALEQEWKNIKDTPEAQSVAWYTNDFILDAFRKGVARAS